MPRHRVVGNHLHIDATDLSRQCTFRLVPDGSGDGLGPSGTRHTRFRTWKEDLLGRT